MYIKRREDLEEGEPICFVGVHVLTWERWKRDYGIPDWEIAFMEDDEESENDEE